MIQIFSHSEVGGHAENEDDFEVRSHPLDPECHICVIADGQGGRSGGGVAAQTACTMCLGTAFGFAPADLVKPDTWTKVLRTVDKAVADASQAGFTTLVAFCIWNNYLCGASSGDSAAVLFHGARRGEVFTERQHKNPPVGSGAAVFIPFCVELISPWTVLAMTDGVWKYAGWETVLRVLPEMAGQEIIDMLRDRAKLQRTGGLQDDFTLLVLQNRDT